MQILGHGNGKKMPKFNFGEMDGVKCPNSIRTQWTKPNVQMIFGRKRRKKTQAINLRLEY